MKTVRNAVLCTLVPLLCAVGTAHAQGGIGHSGSYGPWWDTPATMSMDKMTPQQRDKVVQMEHRMMQTAMKHDQAMAKMESDFMHSMMEMQKQLLELYRGH
ncbi:hypothetical protein [Paraburkholderia sp. BR14374]|uniref:hypothetical protein n=1 Tax=Paraburkholderia sp. BR14374 TaxID=3237007 RepID=UPI0034CEE98E